MSRRTDIVVTTIFEPAWLDGYLQNIREFGHDEEVTVRIICDRKTPKSVFEAAEAARVQGFQVDCPTLAQQSEYLKAVGVPDDLIPWDTDNRRNIGFLRSWANDAEVLISIDDDNYCIAGGGDFVGNHQVVGRAVSDTDTFHTPTAPWFNMCELLEDGIDIRTFPRGYPYSARSEDLAELRDLSPDERLAAVAVNAGLWIGDPDVDAITRLAIGPRVTSAAERSVILTPPTWSPINSQNTSLIGAAIPAYYYARMGYPLNGLRIDRFGDILSGYFLQKCAKHLGQVVRVGSPVADHRRSVHNLLQDLYFELAGIVIMEDFVPWLQSLELSGTTYFETYAALADALVSEANTFRGLVWDQGGRDFLVDTGLCMGQWLDAIVRIRPQ